jgi:hypothetical protein
MLPRTPCISLVVHHLRLPVLEVAPIYLHLQPLHLVANKKARPLLLKILTTTSLLFSCEILEPSHRLSLGRHRDLRQGLPPELAHAFSKVSLEELRHPPSLPLAAVKVGLSFASDKLTLISCIRAYIMCWGHYSTNNSFVTVTYASRNGASDSKHVRDTTFLLCTAKGNAGKMAP